MIENRWETLNKIDKASKNEYNFTNVFLFHNYSRQGTKIVSPEGLSTSNSVVY